MTKGSRYIQSARWGVAIFALLAVLPAVLALLDVSYPPLDRLADWQTLLTGALSLAAALFAGWLLVSQIDQDAEHEKNRILRDHRAARAALPLHLSAVSRYARETGAATLEILSVWTLRSPSITAPRPPLPLSILSDLQAFIRSAPDAEGELVAEIISQMQLVEDNADHLWRSLGGPATRMALTKTNAQAIVARAAVLDAQSGAIFEYARRVKDATAAVPTEADVASALKVIYAFEDTHPEIHRMAAAMRRQLRVAA